MEINPIGIAQIKSDPTNLRLHPARNLEMLETSLAEFGPARSVVIDESDTVLAGNGVLAAAKAVGIKKVIVVEAQPDALVAVRKTGLTEQQKKRLALFDNRSAELSEWDAQGLLALSGESPELLSDLWTSVELEKLESLEAIRAFSRPDHDDLVEKVNTGSVGMQEPCNPLMRKDGNWFYVEYYGQNDIFEELSGRLGQMVGAGGHQLNSKQFAEMVRGYVSKAD